MFFSIDYLQTNILEYFYYKNCLNYFIDSLYNIIIYFKKFYNLSLSLNNCIFNSQCSYWNSIGEMFGDIKFWIYTSDNSLFEDFDEGIYSDHTNFLDYPFYLETQELYDFKDFMNFYEINWADFSITETLINIDIVDLNNDFKLYTNFINISKFVINLEFITNLELVDDNYEIILDIIDTEYLLDILLNIFYNEYNYEFITDLYNELLIFIFIIGVTVSGIINKSIFSIKVFNIYTINIYALILIIIPIIILALYIKNYILNNIIPLIWTFIYKNKRNLFFSLKLYVWYIKKFIKFIFKVLKGILIQCLQVTLFYVIIFFFLYIFKNTLKFVISTCKYTKNSILFTTKYMNTMLNIMLNTVLNIVLNILTTIIKGIILFVSKLKYALNYYYIYFYIINKIFLILFRSTIILKKKNFFFFKFFNSIIYFSYLKSLLYNFKQRLIIKKKKIFFFILNLELFFLYPSFYFKFFYIVLNNIIKILTLIINNKLLTIKINNYYIYIFFNVFILLLLLSLKKLIIVIYKSYFLKKNGLKINFKFFWFKLTLKKLNILFFNKWKVIILLKNLSNIIFYQFNTYLFIYIIAFKKIKNLIINFSVNLFSIKKYFKFFIIYKLLKYNNIIKKIILVKNKYLKNYFLLKWSFFLFYIGYDYYLNSIDVNFKNWINLSFYSYDYFSKFFFNLIYKNIFLFLNNINLNSCYLNRLLLQNEVFENFFFFYNFLNIKIGKFNNYYITINNLNIIKYSVIHQYGLLKFKGHSLKNYCKKV